MAYTEFEVHFGAVVNITTTPVRVRFVQEIKEGDQVRGSLINEGPATVYIGWNKEVVAADDTQEDNKNFMKANDALRIGKSASFASICTAVGTAKVQYVSDL